VPLLLGGMSLLSLLSLAGMPHPHPELHPGVGPFLFALTLGLAWLRVPLRRGGFTSLHFLGAVAAAYLFPPLQAALIAGLALPPARPLRPERELFNRGQLALAGALASAGAGAPPPWDLFLPPVFYLSANLTLTVLLFTLGLGKSLEEVRRNLAPFVLSYGALSPLALLLARVLEKAPLTGVPYLDALSVAVGGVYVYDLWRKTRRLEEAILAILETTVRLLEAKDPYTAHHSERVAAIALEIGREMGLPPTLLESLEAGARLHDVGKVSVPDALLGKEGGLSPEEWAVMREHPAAGAKALAPIASLLGKEAVEIARYHHERWDGEGYPEGLRGEEIPLLARIVAVADAYEAMTSDRPYRRALSPEEAARRIEEGAGSQFDPEVAEAFLRVWRRGGAWVRRREFVLRTVEKS
jgi:HD superfamily phosphodiesterase